MNIKTDRQRHVYEIWHEGEHVATTTYGTDLEIARLLASAGEIDALKAEVEQLRENNLTLRASLRLIEDMGSSTGAYASAQEHCREMRQQGYPRSLILQRIYWDLDHDGAFDKCQNVYDMLKAEEGA